MKEGKPFFENLRFFSNGLTKKQSICSTKARSRYFALVAVEEPDQEQYNIFHEGTLALLRTGSST